jgi:Tol biopolymer transport system component
MDAFPDGAIAYLERSESGGFDIYRLPPQPGASPAPLLRSRPSKFEMRLSPDGRAMAFAAEVEGEEDLYVVEIPVAGAPVVAASRIASPPRWSADGRTLYYLGDNGTMMATAVSTMPELSVGTPRPIFRLERPARFMDVAPDGRFLMLVSEVHASQQPIAVTTGLP